MKSKQPEFYTVTGVTVNGKRFVKSFGNAIQALGINLWRGSVWAVYKGKRKLIKQVVN